MFNIHSASLNVWSDKGHEARSSSPELHTFGLRTPNMKSCSSDVARKMPKSKTAGESGPSNERNRKSKCLDAAIK